MAPKKNVRDVTPSTVAHSQTSTTGAGSTPVHTKSSSSKSSQSPAEIALGIWQRYLDTTPQRTKLIDVFMAFLVTVGVLQFVYCVIVGNYVRFPRYEDIWTAKFPWQLRTGNRVENRVLT
jgi:oligosaccharyltransferase complex subunit epsilon